MKGIWAAYSDTGALAVSCKNCGAEPGKWCARDDGRVRRVPCVERIAASGVVTGGDNKYGRDFSEPQHPAADG